MFFQNSNKNIDEIIYLYLKIFVSNKKQLCYFKNVTRVLFKKFIQLFIRIIKYYLIGYLLLIIYFWVSRQVMIYHYTMVICVLCYRKYERFCTILYNNESHEIIDQNVKHGISIFNYNNNASNSPFQVQGRKIIMKIPL